MSDILYRPESYEIIGVCMEVHRILGMGLKEINYKDAMEIEFIERGIPYVREKQFTIVYKGRVLRRPYQPDFVVYDKIVAEVKSVPAICAADIAQGLSYLTATRLKLGLLINFGEQSLAQKRLIR